MENNLKFNSQVATSRSQSERLLALGLKKETADCYYWQETDRYGDGNGKFHLELLAENREHAKYLDECFGVCLEEDEEHYFIPAWSLHRLIEILDTNPCVFYTNCGYDNIIDRIEDYIKERFIDTRYLEEWCLNEEE